MPNVEFEDFVAQPRGRKPITEPVVNEYTELVQQLAVAGSKRVAKLSFTEGDEDAKTVTAKARLTARTHGLTLNLRSAPGEYPVLFSVSKPKPAVEAPAENTDAAPDASPATVAAKPAKVAA
jgi:hypothetical protein